MFSTDCCCCLVLEETCHKMSVISFFTVAWPWFDICISKQCKYFIEAFNSVIQLTVATVISSLLQTLSNLTALIASQCFAKSRGCCKGVDSKSSMIEQVCAGDDHVLDEVFILCKRKHMGKSEEKLACSNFVHIKWISIVPTWINKLCQWVDLCMLRDGTE